MKSKTNFMNVSIKKKPGKRMAVKVFPLFLPFSDNIMMI